MSYHCAFTLKKKKKSLAHLILRSTLNLVPLGILCMSLRLDFWNSQPYRHENQPILGKEEILIVSFTVKTHTGFPYGNQIFRKNYSTSSSSFILFSFHYNSQLAFSFFPDVLIICLKLFCAQYLLRLIFFLMTCPN